MPTLGQLLHVIAVADTLRFGRSAQACCVTQPALNLQLKELESRLNAGLVERTRVQILLTPVERKIAHRAKRMLADVDDIKAVAGRGDQ